MQYYRRGRGRWWLVAPPPLPSSWAYGERAAGEALSAESAFSGGRGTPKTL